MSRKFFALLMLGVLAVGAAGFTSVKAGSAGDCGAPPPCDGCVPATGCDGCDGGCPAPCGEGCGGCEETDCDSDHDDDCDD